MYTPNKRKTKIIKSLLPINTSSFMDISRNNSKEKTYIKEFTEQNRPLSRTKTYFRGNNFKQQEFPALNKTKTHKNSVFYIKKPVGQKSKSNNYKKILNITNSNSNLLANNISNLKTRGNSALNLNNTSEFDYNDNSKEKLRSKNFINFKDRIRLKTTKVLGLKLYEQFEEDKRKNNLKNKDTNDNLIRINNSLDTTKSNQENSILDNVIEQFDKNKKHKSKRNIQYSLKQLIKLNPYHYVSTRVRYNNAIEMEKISEKLSNVNSVKPYQKATTKNFFFKGNFNTKLLKAVKVEFNNNLAYKGGSVWRILSKFQKNMVFSEFKQICKFQGYTELWKYYGMLLEKLILNYPIFKWFLEKEKLMDQDVFKEYLHILKIEMSKDESFPRKVFLLFDDYGEGKINIKIFFFVMKLVSNTSDIDKLNFYIKLFEDVNRTDKELCINVLEMFDVLKNIIPYNGMRKIKNNLLKNLRKELNDDKPIESDYYITKNQMISFLLNNKLMNTIIAKFKKEYKFAYINYNEKINNIFFNTVRNVQKFLNEQKEVNSICGHDVNNYEKILGFVRDKEQNVKKLNEYINYIENEEQ